MGRIKKFSMALSSYQEQFINHYAPYAMEEQIKTGIPASVTLGQMILESYWGQKSIGNNCFGIKVGNWNGPTIINPRDGQAYRNYPTIEDGIQDHSNIIIKKSEYSTMRTFPSTDYHNWLVGIQRGHYAEDPKYISKVENVIRSNGLSRFDHAAIDVAKRNGIEIGSGISLGPSQQIFYLNYVEDNFHMPLDFNQKGVYLTGYFKEPRGTHQHQGFDISTAHTNLPLYATESGKVIAVKPNNGNAGNMIAMEYNRGGQPAYRVTYMHLQNFNVQAGQTIKGGDIIGRSGNTGFSTGEHLHIEVQAFDRQTGNWVRYDPAKYLAEIAVRSKQSDLALYDRKGNNVLSRDEHLMALGTPPQEQQQQQQLEGIDQNNLLASLADSNDPLKMMYTYMQTQGDDGQGMLSGLISQIFKTAMSVGVQLMATEALSGMTEEEKKQDEQAQKEADKTKIDSKEDAIYRDYEKVDGKELRATASLNFEAASEQQQRQQQQIDYQLKG